MMSIGFGAGMRGIRLAVAGDAPTVSAVSPDLGDVAGGETLTITGTGFTGVTDITIGGTAGTSVTFISDTSVTCVAPAHAAAASQSVVVTTPAGSNAPNTLYEFWSPASLTLTGYWDKGNYTAGNWPGLASAGSSNGRDLTQTTPSNKPTAVADEPDCDGTDDYLTNATAMSTMVSASAGTIIAIFDADTADAPIDSYVDPAIVGDNASYLAMYFNTSGVNAFVLDAGRVVVTKAAATGVRHLAMMRWDGANLGLTLGVTAEVTAACGSVLSLAGTVLVGASYATAQFFDGRIRTILVLASKLSDANYTKVRKWAQACRGLP